MAWGTALVLNYVLDGFPIENRAESMLVLFGHAASPASSSS
jgi:hypothetical protein